MLKKYTLCTLAALFFTVTCMSPTWAAPIVIKAAHGAPESNVQHLGWLKFKEVLEAKSGGNIIVEVYGNNQLGPDREICEATQMGSITVVSNSTAAATAFNKEFYVFDAPFLFKDRDEAYAALDGPLGQAILTSDEQFNLKGLGFWENGFRALSNSKRPIHTPEDVAGLKLRTMESSLHIATWRAIGANPTPMAFGELFTALQQKTVDGQDNAMDMVYAAKFYEVQKHLTKTNHNYSPLIVHMNLEFWNDLSPENQALIMESMKETTDWQREKARQLTVEAEDHLKKAGMQIVDLTPEQMQMFRDKVRPVYAMIKDSVSPNIYALFEGLIQ